MMTRLSVCLLLLFVLFACKKEKEEPAPDRRTLLTDRSWRLSEVLANNVPVTDPALLAMLGAFNQTTIRFNNDGTLTATQTNGTVSSGTWEFGSTQDQLQVNLGGQPYQFTIKQLDAARLVLTTPYSYQNIPITAELRMIPA